MAGDRVSFLVERLPDGVRLISDPFERDPVPVKSKAVTPVFISVTVERSPVAKGPGKMAGKHEAVYRKRAPVPIQLKPVLEEPL